MSEKVAILGASTNTARFSYKAQVALLAHGHTPVPINPKYGLIDGIRCYPDLRSVAVDIDTVTIYVRPDILCSMTEDLIDIHPKRVIFNPGSECRAVSDRLAAVDIEVLNACTLVLLETASFQAGAGS